MNSIRVLTFESVLIRLVVAMLLGGFIGFERGRKNRAAGLRTYLLVCLGSCMLMMINQYVYQAFHTGDPLRLTAQIVSGIGFLGAGTIIVTHHNQIRGLTTAAGLWASAAIGIAVGIGLYEVAVPGGIAIFFILTVVNHWDYAIHKKQKFLQCYIVLDNDVSFVSFLDGMNSLGFEVLNIQHHKTYRNDLGMAISITIKSTGKMRHDQIMAAIRSTKGVAYVEEITC